MKSLLYGGQVNAISTVYLDNTTHYQGFTICGGGFAEAAVQLKIAIPGTIRNMRMHVPTNTATVTSVIYFRKNGADAGPTFSYTSAQTGEKEDTSNSTTVAADDLINIRVTIPSVAGSTYLQVANWHVEFEPTDRTKTLTLVGQGHTTGGISTASVTRYPAWLDNFAVTNTSDVSSFGLFGGGTVTRWSSYATNIRATATTRQLVVNGANSTTHQNSHTVASTWVHDDSTSTVSSGDTIGQSVTTGTGTDTFTGGSAYAQIVNDAGQWTTVVADNTVVTPTAGGTFYISIAGGLNGQNATSDAAVERRFRHASSAEYLWTNLASNATTGGNTDFTFRLNAVDQTGLQTRYTSAQTGVKSDTATIAIASGDMVSVGLVVGTGGNVSYRTLSVGFNSTLNVTTTGTIAATEAQDTAAISGTVTSGSATITGTLAATEAQDTASITGINYTVITGTLTATEAQDTAAIVGVNYSVVTGTLAATESPDVAAMAGVAYTAITGTLAATEAQDTAAMTGIAYTAITGLLDAIEAQDTAALSGTVATGPATITGTLAATEAQDTAAITGINFTVITGTLAATEGQDTVSIQGIYIQNITGTLNATEAQDTCSIIAYLNGVPVVSWIDGVGYGTVSGAGVVDVAHTDAGTEVSSVSQNKMDSTVRRWRA